MLEQEITVAGTVDTVQDGRASTSAEATQDGKRIIRNAEADLRVD